ncbi:uncharacterized protein [Musca autumnalis]|uniref:uncharacterized protein n=1 Tax=Musca autumnalis TaxID=221902 RepID=UPI003CEDED7A
MLATFPEYFSLEKLLHKWCLKTRRSDSAINSRSHIIELNMNRGALIDMREVSLVPYGMLWNNVVSLQNSQHVPSTAHSGNVSSARTEAGNLPVQAGVIAAGGTVSEQLPMSTNLTGAVPKPKKIYPLPEFSGTPEEWATFIEDFKCSTREFGYSQLQNLMRLRDSLKGRAKETVEALLTNSSNVDEVIHTLEETFGRPELLLKSQISNVRKIRPVVDGDMEGLVIFANKVINMVTFIRNARGEHHLSNPSLLSELVTKLPQSRQIQWAEKSLTVSGPATVADFSA